MNKFEEFFFNNKNTLLISKWHHYLKIYERHLSKYQNTNPIILEIGTNEGGGAEMLNYYFDNKCTIITIDINQKGNVVTKFNNIKFMQGDQSDPKFLLTVIKEVDHFDIIIDDGGHKTNQQIESFKRLYRHLSPNGTYIIEDVHTSYWSEYINTPESFIDFTKRLIDRLNVWHWKKPFIKDELSFCKNTDSIHYYDSVVVLERCIEKDKPLCERRDPNRIDSCIWDDNEKWKNNQT